MLSDSSNVFPAGIDPDQDLLVSIQILPLPVTSAAGVETLVTSLLKWISMTQLSISVSGVISIVISKSWPLLTMLLMISSQLGEGGKVEARVVVVVGPFVVVVVVVVLEGPPQISCPSMSARIR